MTDSVLSRFASSHVKPANQGTPSPTESEIEHATDCWAFGLLRGIRDRAVMIELRKKDGNVRALGYAWLGQADFDPSNGITLDFGRQKVRIRGRNLNQPSGSGGQLFDGICRHRVAWVREADELSAMKTGEHETLVEQIDW
jgi:hypothetical protein